MGIYYLFKFKINKTFQKHFNILFHLSCNHFKDSLSFNIDAKARNHIQFNKIEF